MQHLFITTAKASCLILFYFSVGGPAAVTGSDVTATGDTGGTFGDGNEYTLCSLGLAYGQEIVTLGHTNTSQVGCPYTVILRKEGSHGEDNEEKLDVSDDCKVTIKASAVKNKRVVLVFQDEDVVVEFVLISCVDVSAPLEAVGIFFFVIGVMCAIYTRYNGYMPIVNKERVPVMVFVLYTCSAGISAVALTAILVLCWHQEWVIGVSLPFLCQVLIQYPIDALTLLKCPDKENDCQRRNCDNENAGACGTNNTATINANNQPTGQFGQPAISGFNQPGNQFSQPATTGFSHQPNQPTDQYSQPPNSGFNQQYSAWK